MRFGKGKKIRGIYKDRMRMKPLGGMKRERGREGTSVLYTQSVHISSLKQYNDLSLMNVLITCYLSLSLLFSFFQMVQAIQVLRFHLLELEKVSKAKRRSINQPIPARGASQTVEQYSIFSHVSFVSHIFLYCTVHLRTM